MTVEQGDAEPDKRARAVEEWDRTHAHWKPWTDRDQAYDEYQREVTAWATANPRHPELFPGLTSEQAYDLFIEANLKWIRMWYGEEEDDDEDLMDWDDPPSEVQQ